MSETLGDLALEVRSKNAGPFWTTLELFMRDEAGYAVAADEDLLNEDVIARLYGAPVDQIRFFRIPALNVVKISFPRVVPQGGFRDRDVHSGQHHVPLAALTPTAAGARNGADG
ncbi:DUF4387 domain-containing protein [Nocardiopsis aegyptia]|uniref:DUF4387 domain-containing protein n=1 Tax=Nocardiopsis aegyptia TaxID=220378 RepID=A0A7Z0EII1_9ACTN|nr:DUF4387 domain-containing protein [Nocardiopsis aegyptia]NYJ32577.1 hypothetical protein [Nocardiopsis aegyptia]